MLQQERNRNSMEKGESESNREQQKRMKLMGDMRNSGKNWLGHGRCFGCLKNAIDVHRGCTDQFLPILISPESSIFPLCFVDLWSYYPIQLRAEFFLFYCSEMSTFSYKIFVKFIARKCKILKQKGKKLTKYQFATYLSMCSSSGNSRDGFFAKN